MEQGEERLPKVSVNLYTKFIKRLLDLGLSLIALILFSPVMAVISVLELVFHGIPITFSTGRPGKDGKIFKMYKFRSMTNKKDEEGLLLPDEQRLTKFGKILRKTSLDELPELFCILKGDMSVIGPRPLLTEYLPLYPPRYAMRHAVRPGLACFPLNRDKNSGPMTWRAQFEGDIWYIEHLNFITDVKMIFAIFKELFSPSESRVTGTRIPFTGDNLDDTRSYEEYVKLGLLGRYESIGK